MWVQVPPPGFFFVPLPFSPPTLVAGRTALLPPRWLEMGLNYTIGLASLVAYVAEVEGKKIMMWLWDAQQQREHNRIACEPGGWAVVGVSQLVGQAPIGQAGRLRVIPSTFATAMRRIPSFC